MDKSMYSIMLMDEVIKAVDKAAYRNGTNRSNLINQILAQHLGVKTPEMRASEILNQLIQEISKEGELTVLKEPSDFLLSLKSPLDYKYRPTVKYSIELFRTQKGNVGELRVSFRTQSDELLSKLTGFFKLWMLMEAHYIHNYFPKDAIEYEAGDGRFKRSFPVCENTDLTEVSVLCTAISQYVNSFDISLKTYLYEDLSPDGFEDMYLKSVKSNQYII